MKIFYNLEKVLGESYKLRDYKGFKGSDSGNYKWVVIVIRNIIKSNG